MLRYSICVTHYNNGPWLTRSLESIFRQIDSRFEVVIVDNFSNDGSEKILKGYANRGAIQLIQVRCNRGRGRQIAFENSHGEYILAHLDLDDIFRPVLKQAVDLYHSQAEGFLLLYHYLEKEHGIRGPGLTIAPRSIIESVGGWRDLQYGEDWDLWSRAARMGLYKYTNLNVGESRNMHLDRRSAVTRALLRYRKYRDHLRLGRTLFGKGESVLPSQRLIGAIAKLTYHFSRTYVDPFNRTFNYLERSYLLTTKTEDRYSHSEKLGAE